MTGERIRIGRVMGVHGIAGEVLVEGENRDPAEVGRYRDLRWRGLRGEVRQLAVTGFRIHRGRALVALEGVADRSAAGELVGGVLDIDAGDLKPPPEDAYYIADLIGLTVVTTDGRTVGPVTTIYEGAAHDLYAVEFGGREVLIPAVDAIVKNIDPAAGRIVIEAPEGLLE